jgi:hypothetical protein
MKNSSDTNENRTKYNVDGFHFVVHWLRNCTGSVKFGLKEGHAHRHTYIWQSSLSYDLCVEEMSFRIGSVGKFRG